MKRRRWTPAEDARFRQLFPGAASRKVAKRLGRSLASVSGRASTLGLKKSPAYLELALARCGRDLQPHGRRHQFPPGHVPANKGLRRPGWSPGRMKEAQFKKGQAGWNWRPIGATRLVGGYVYTKISDRRRVPWTKNWRPTHALLWEKHRGRVPAGHALAFRNGDRSDIRLGNLELVTKAAIMARNTIHTIPSPLKETIYTLATLKRKINRRSRHEKQDRRSA